MTDTLDRTASVSPPSRQVYLAILSLLAVSFMLFQIALLRELRYQLTTLFTLTPFLFSSVIFWIALGSLCAGRIRSRSRDVLRRCAVVLPVILLPLFAATLGTAQSLVSHAPTTRFQYGVAAGPTAGDAYLSSTILAFVAVAVFGYGLIFFLQGLIFALYFREGREEGILSEVYAVDLLASGGGALIGGALTFVLTPVQTVVLAALLLLTNLCVSFRYLGIPRIHLVAAWAFTGIMVVAELGAGVLSHLENPRWLPPGTLAVWSRYRRIDAVDSPSQLSVFADGVLFQLHGKGSHSHEGDPRNLTASVIRSAVPPVRDLLIIGAGSGSDVRLLTDVLPERLAVTAVELDEGFVRTAAAFPWLWDRYRTAEILIQEGRYYLENTRREFDLVLYAYIDPQSAVGSIGLPDANFLYTDAGLRAAFARVRDSGTLLITRVFLVQEEAEFVRRTCATLRSAGILPEHTRIYRRLGGVAWGYYGNLTTLHIITRKGRPPAPVADADMVAVPWSEGERPTTDLFPFSLGTGIWFDTLLGYLRRQSFPLVVLGGVAVAIAAAMATSAARATFFVLGFGSFLLESMVLFNSFLLLGDPNLSAALAVGLFLIWNGVGSMLSGRLEDRKWVYAAVPAAVLLYGVTAPYLNAHTIAASLPVRCLAFALHLSLGGIAAGVMFPVTLRRFRDRSVPAMFFMDVVGCALAPPVFWLAMSLTGVWVLIAGAAASYLVVCLVVAFRR